MGILTQSKNPFVQKTPLLVSSRIHSPYAARIETLWRETREQIIEVFPKAPGLPKNGKQQV
ncbi:MAG: hypothetical protein A3C55_04470 [Gammaproteobacteria bacterium RIFCSPHIGHO2_02_FULL_42_13]|nr:MAG: hypothetical protein A3C55_04470 [Gammaproteobacteria bacterium RIFCSPHIGHO2_02_FULL_42_13]